MIRKSIVWCDRWFKQHLMSVLAVSLFLLIGHSGYALESEESGLTPEQETELQYADQLLDAGLPNYAALLLERLNLPAEIMAIREIRSLTARGQFDEARKIVDANAGTSQGAMTLKLALADGYYAWGKYNEAQALYEEFFKAFPQGPDEGIRQFYMNSAYRYAKMMELTGNRKAGAEAYRMVLRANPERHVQRQIQSELAELLMLQARDATGADRKELLDEVQKIADDILWVQDLWFGRAIVLLAHMRVLEDDIEGAMQLVQDYTPQLRTIDQALREQSEEIGEDLTRLSPMAQCRYLIAEIMHDRAVELLETGGDRQEALELLIGRRMSGGRQGDGAVQHFLNVFIRYPNTSWAPHAGNRFRQVEALLESEFDRRVNAKVTDEQWKEVERAQFREARTLFNQGRFADAAESYLDVLTLFPEQSTSIPAFGEYAASLIEVEDFVLADTVLRHVAERFGAHEEFSVEAGNQVIRIAGKYLDVNQHERHREAYAVFFEHFRSHPRTVLDLQRFALEAMGNEDYDTATRYFTQIIEDFKGRQAYYDALSNMARIFAFKDDQNNQARALMRLIKDLDEAGKRGHLRVNAAFRLADLMREMGPRFADRAQAMFRSVQELLEGEKAADYAATPAEAEANQRLLQGALFYIAVIDIMRTTVPDNVGEALRRRAAPRELSDEEILNNFYKAGAIRQLNQLVETFPESPFAPAALSQVGTLNTILGRADAAAEALRKLERDYPDSREAANAVFMIGLSLLEMGRRDEAIRYFMQMFEGDTQYPASQILRAGQELLAADEFQIALQAFDRVIAASDERRTVEPARIGKGQALIGLERYQEAADLLDKVIEDYPSSGMTIITAQAASAANAAVASQTADREQRTLVFNKAVDFMRRAIQFAQDPGMQAELEVAVAGVLARRAEAEERFGTPERAEGFRNEVVAAYQTLIMFRDASNPAVAPFIEIAYGRAVPLMLEMERWDDVVVDAQGYLDKFPNGRLANEMRRARTTAELQGGGNVAE